MLSAGTRLGPYEIVGPIGAGGMGEVYRAHDDRLERDVALKVLPPGSVGDAERLERFVREARALAALNHPHIVTIYSTEEADGIPFLTMELVQGQPLTELIASGGLPLSRFYELAVPLADAIAAAHDKQVTHRDLKPGNIMVSNDGRLKVLDFGLAAISAPASEDKTQMALTQEGAVLGTLPYMSPEQVEGKAVDCRSDIFSLGVILYELATGRRPFGGESHASLASSILRDTPVPVGRVRPDLPAGVTWMIMRCLDKSPADRHLSGHEITRQLLEVSRAGHTAGEAPARELSVAVLPFANLSSDPENEYFSDGLTEELIGDLSAVKALRVISRASAGLGLGITQVDGSVLVGNDAYLARYSVWSSRLGPLVAAFVDGSSNFLKAIGLPAASATALMGVFVASFAGTTLDSACRLQRYVIQELAATAGVRDRRAGFLAFLGNKYGATLLAVTLAAFIAAIPPPGKEWAIANAGQGGLILWPLFGATNQLLGGLSFLVITFYLWRRGVRVWFIALPMVFMLIMPMWAMLWQVFIGGEGNPSWLSQRNWLLVSIALTTMALEVWMIVEAWRVFPRAKGIIEDNAIQPVRA
jgi:serine/threonine protein kinase